MSTSAPPAEPTSRWLHGPIRDLLFGCGVGYALLFVFQSLEGDWLRDAVPLAIAIILTSVFAGSPHYGATILRVYERRADRRAYALFGLWMTLLLVGVFAWSVWSAVVGSWFLTVYLTWSPWHYAGQNFGVAMMYLRRRGVEVTPWLRRCLWWSFVLSFVLAFLALHGEDPRANYAPSELGAGEYQFRSLGIPEAVHGPLFGLCAALYLLSTGAASLMLLARARLSDFFPTAVLLGSQLLWFALPALARYGGFWQGVEPLGVEHYLYSFLWIGAAHSLQYLWITSYFAVRSGTSGHHSVFLLKSVLAGAAIWTVPGILFAPSLLGRVPLDAGLALMVASLINIHHFMLDGVIWKLRHARIARVLIRRAPEDADAAADTGPSWGHRVAFGVGALALAVSLYAKHLELSFNREMNRGDLARAEAAAVRLGDIGYDSAQGYLQLGMEYMRLGQLDEARKRFEQSIALHPTAWAWYGLGDLHSGRQAWPDARAAYESALAIDPDQAAASFHLGIVCLRMDDRDAARAALRHAARIIERDPGSHPERLRNEVRKALTRHGFASAPE